jgi:hypothetical protein
VARVIGVDIGDAGSRSNRAELGTSGKLMVIAGSARRMVVKPEEDPW